jgi:c-di-AMP phosphodiesterase-like protein
MHYLEQYNKTGLLLLVDFEKAFDSVEWKFLKKPSQVLILDHLFVNGLNYSIQKPKVSTPIINK